MNDQTYTAVGYLDLGNNLIALDIALPNPPKREDFSITYYNLSKRSEYNNVLMNVILCEFTYKGDEGEELSRITKDRYHVSIDFTKIEKPEGIPNVTDFNFVENPKCLFLFFHSTDANAEDRQAFFDDMEKLYLGAIKSPYVMYPAPYLKNTNPNGRPRVMSPSLI